MDGVKIQLSILMRILFFSQSNYPFSGTDTFLVNLIENWDPEDEKIIMYNSSFRDSHRLIELSKKCKNTKYISLDIPTIQDIYTKYKFFKNIYPIFRPFIFIFYIFKLLPIIKKINPDAIISINGGYPAGEMNLAIVVAAKIVGIKKVILNIHNFPKRRSVFLSPDYFLDLLISFTCDEIVTVSAACARELKEKRNFKKDIIYIHNGINITTNIAQTPEKNIFKKLNISTRDDIIGFVGLLEERKGLDFLIEAMPKILSRRPSAKLVIIGSGDQKYEKKLRHRIMKLNLSDKVIFTGYLKNAYQYIKSFDVLVLPSIEFENCPMVILEAMLNKVPVVATKVGGMPELIEDGKTGFIVEPGNPDMIADRVLYLLENHDKSKKFGLNGYNRLLSNFTSQTMTKKYEMLIKSSNTN